MAHVLHAHGSPSVELVYLLDANARIGSELSRHVGPVAAEFQNLPGELLHRFLQETEQRAPSTFLDSGQSSAATWFPPGPHGLCKGRRIDYITGSFGAHARQQLVLSDIDLTVSITDHLMVASRVSVSLSKQVLRTTGSHKIKRDQCAFDNPDAVQSFVQRMRQCPVVPFQVSPTSHFDAASAHLRQSLEVSFPVRSTPRGRKPGSREFLRLRLTAWTCGWNSCAIRTSAARSP